MSSLFIEILNMSLSAGCVALIVMLIRLSLRKAPKIYSYALWAVVFIRLICPFTIHLPISAVPVQSRAIPQDIIYSDSPAIQSGVTAVDNAVNTAIERSLPTANPIASINPVQVALAFGTFLWLAGVLVLLLYGIVSYLHLTNRIKTAIRVHDNIFETDLIKTAFVLGFLHPRIYIPTGLNSKEMEYVIEHERTHIRRFDYLIKPIAFLVVIVHWFNPVVWISYALMAKDMELSADECVLKQYAYDIRGNYSNSLLALSVKRSGLLSPLAFGETGVKSRIKNVLHYKKPAFWVSVMAAVVVAVVSLVLVISRQTETTPESSSIQSAAPSPIADNPTVTPEPVYSTEYDSVDITYHSDYVVSDSVTEFGTTVPSIVAYVDRILSTSLTPSQEDDLDNNYTNRYTIKLTNDVSEYSCELYYDTLYVKAYLLKDGGLYETETDFARYIDSFQEYTDITFRLDDINAVALFQEYGWTLDYQISAMKNKLNNIKTLSVFNPNAYYFAYSNELSKDIGLDLSGYSDITEIDVMIYRIHESMPQEFYPTQNCRGIVVKNGAEIIGAYISAGRHSTFNACSLKGKSFEEVTGQTINEWLTGMIKADSTEERLSKLAPEQVIEEYIAALDNKDANLAQYCISKETMLDELATNMSDDKIFNEVVRLPLTDTISGSPSSFDNLKSAKLSKVELVNETEDNIKIYGVTVNLQYNTEQSIGSGNQTWDCYMVYESPQTGWKIESFGH